jgi:hypothetical protein
LQGERDARQAFRRAVVTANRIENDLVHGIPRSA